MGKAEAHVEDYLVARCKQAKAEIRKVGWIGRKNAPDRFILTYGENTINFWAECKSEKGKLSSGQEREIALMRERGEIVHVFHTREDVDRVFGPIVRGR